ncbi:putativelike family protein [Phaeomoniella chlamydospora]|uniref:Putativelike family protein n=1 Tax=Phaeomoniella chlamydospora TaxID=158046 RepID=A0A0G2DWS6_PHACM|nr:putativelike family protein [Phaeomoniella chlamydospora]
MSTIKNVAIIGASGNLGTILLKELQNAGFNITVLSRENSTSTFPSGVTVKKVNYESTASLKEALQGQDAVVSTTASAAVGNQVPIVDAAIAAGVKRFIPSEFGINTRTLTHPGLKTILGGKIKTFDYLIEKSKENPSFTYTGVSSSLFFDWGLKFTGLGFNKANKTFNVVDSGNESYSVSSLPFIGRAVASILTHPEKTANQYLLISGFTTTQNQLLKLVEEESGEKWTVQNIRSADLDKTGFEKLSKGDFSAFVNFLQAYVHADGAGLAVKDEESANKVLGLESEDPRPFIKKWLDGTL